MNRSKNWLVLFLVLLIFILCSKLLFLHQSVDFESSMQPLFSSENIENVYKYFHWSNQTACQLSIDFGFKLVNYDQIVASDGHKSVCLDPLIAPIFGQCLIYSFGINNEWTFDEAMESFGCHVYSFDPSMGVDDHNRTDRIHFYNIGLNGEDGDVIVENKKWKMKTLPSIYRMLRPFHGTQVIDILKMDIEFSEWDVLPQIIQSEFAIKHVKQINVEVHFNTEDTFDTFVRRFNILRDLEASGFVRYSSRINPWLRGPIAIMNDQIQYIGFEMAWFNSKFKHNRII